MGSHIKGVLEIVKWPTTVGIFFHQKQVANWKQGSHIKAGFVYHQADDLDVLENRYQWAGGNSNSQRKGGGTEGRQIGKGKRHWEFQTGEIQTRELYPLWFLVLPLGNTIKIASPS